MKDQDKSKRQLISELDELRHSERMLRTLTDASPESILLMDSKGTILFANTTTARRLGKTNDEIVGHTPYDVLPSEVAAVRMRHFDEVVRTGEPVRFDDERSGRYIENAVHPVLDEQGKVAAVAVFGIDRIERKQAQESLKRAHDELERRVKERTADLAAANRQLSGEADVRRTAEEALRQSLNQLRAIYDGMFEGLLILDFETKRLIRVNSSLCRMLGYTEDELLSMSVLDIHPADEAPALLQRLRARVGEGYRDDVDVPVLRKDGRVLYANVIGNPLVFRGRQCIAAFFRDITERKHAQAALRQNRDELQAIYDQIMDGIIIADAERLNPVRVNPAFCRMLGYSEEEAYALLPDRVHPPEVLPTVREHFEAVKKGAVARIDNLPFLCRDGSIVYADVISSPIRYNERPCWISFFHDVTGRKRAEEALRREQRTLKHLLESSDHERQLIAYEIHDGLAQQLAGAIMQLQTFDHLKQRKPKEAAKAYDAGVTMLQQGHFEARRLIAGVRPPVLDEEGVVAAIAHLVHEQSRRMKPKIEYRSRVDFDRLVPILENAIYRIAQEGLANACQHSKSEKVRVSLLQREDRVRIEIRDWGTGFHTRGTRQGCYGLVGMRQRARLLGGRCSIRSTVGKGTCVTVELPAVARDAERADGLS